jgi:2-polyprenyl-6-methoxyphenol hydroxylase-like FAD-dependent oxidoreductase
MSNLVADQLEAQMSGCRVRILIVGAGIAGATLNALLRQRGERPAMIERNPAHSGCGYMLGLMPLGGRVLNGLGLSEALARDSLDMRYYEIFDRHGQSINRYDLSELFERFGALRGVERGKLLSLLRNASGPICYDTKVKSLENLANGALARFEDGSQLEFDVIVGADGIHSDTRHQILSTNDVEDFDTGWGGFVMWSNWDGFADDTYAELWSSGWGLGLYPVPGRIGMFVAGRHDELHQANGEDYAKKIEAQLPDGPFRKALQARDHTDSPTYWKMADCRSKTWSNGRIVLLGDAAAAFLPTAGVGASAAMDSAAALADELSRADAKHMHYALELFEKRQKHRVEIAEKNSRDLSKLMFINSAPGAWARDKLMEFYTLKHLIDDISKVMSGD